MHFHRYDFSPVFPSGINYLIAFLAAPMMTDESTKGEEFLSKIWIILDRLPYALSLTVLL